MFKDSLIDDPRISKSMLFWCNRIISGLELVPFVEHTTFSVGNNIGPSPGGRILCKFLGEGVWL